MKESFKKKLEKAGWVVGNASDFLELNEEEASYLEIKLSLTDALVERRNKIGISQAELAKAMHSSQSRVAKMEAGDTSVSADLLIKALLCLGLRAKEVGRCFARQTKKYA
jgi:ribosome-binding protein aMBF1 (putative translation factor)